jgi:hypothetical protein
MHYGMARRVVCARVRVCASQLVKWNQRVARTPAERRRKARWVFRLTKQFLALAHPARAALCHPVLPGAGREVSRLFAPSRCEQPLAERKPASKSCAVCNPHGFVWPTYPDSDDERDDEDATDSEEEERRAHVEWEEAVREGREDGSSEDEEAREESAIAAAAEAATWRASKRAAKRAAAQHDDTHAAAAQPSATAASSSEPSHSAAPSIAASAAASAPEHGGSCSAACECPCSADSGTVCPLVAMPRKVCGAAEVHWCHRCCLEQLVARADDDSGGGSGSAGSSGSAADAPEAYPLCPRCQHHRQHLALGADEEEWEGECTPAAGLSIARDVLDANDVSFGGLKQSSKMLHALRIIRAVPADEAVLVFSWFKGTLDVMERLLHERLQLRASRTCCADVTHSVLLPHPLLPHPRSRCDGSCTLTDAMGSICTAGLDGDVQAKTRKVILADFVNGRSSRVMLLTLSTGGVGVCA